MGANQSAELANAVDEAEQAEAAKNATAAGAAGGIRLYKYILAGDSGRWETLSSNAQPRFYDLNQDTGAKHAEWHLEIEAGDIDVCCNDNDLAYGFAVREKRITFSSGGSIFALKYPSQDAAQAFTEALRDKCFYNEHKFDIHDEDKAKKALGADGGFLTMAAGEDMLKPMDEGDDFKDAAEDAEWRANGDGAGSSKPPGTPMTEKKAKSLRGRGRGRDDEEDEEVVVVEDEEAGAGDDAFSAIIMGAGANNFLLRGSHFDVVRNAVGGVTDPGISFQLNTPILSGSGGGRGGRTPGFGGTPGHAITPGRVLLTHGERKMNLLTPGNKNVMYHADPEAGKIVSTWTFAKDGVDIPMLDIAHDHKAGQLESRDTFVSLDANRLCRWDMRVARGVVQSSDDAAGSPQGLGYADGKDYSRGTNFTCMSTSGNGYVAVGARDGKIRLYPGAKMDRAASTSIPGLGAPITAIDVTFDGKWVLATTDKYLMLVKTTFNDDKGKACDGFASKMGGRGTAPRLLRLKPEDSARLKHAPFVKAKFTWVTEGGVNERWIVAGCGSASIIWNFARVRGGAGSVGPGGLATVTDYIINSKQERVVEASFLHQRYAPADDEGGHAALVVATKHDLFNVGN